MPNDSHSVFAAKTPELQIVMEDPDDDRLIECAAALKGQYIVSGDRTVTAIRDYMGIRCNQ